MAVAAIPVALELGEMLIASLAAQGGAKLVNQIYSTGIEGAGKAAADQVLKLGKTLYKDSLTQAGRDKVIKKAGKLAVKGASGVKEATAFLKKHHLLSAKLARRFDRGVGKFGGGFQSVMGHLSKANRTFSRFF